MKAPYLRHNTDVRRQTLKLQAPGFVWEFRVRWLSTKIQFIGSRNTIEEWATYPYGLNNPLCVEIDFSGYFDPARLVAN